jgi:hypothetical protein
MVKAVKDVKTLLADLILERHLYDNADAERLQLHADITHRDGGGQ